MATPVVQVAPLAATAFAGKKAVEAAPQAARDAQRAAANTAAEAHRLGTAAAATASRWGATAWRTTLDGLTKFTTRGDKRTNRMRALGTK